MASIEEILSKCSVQELRYAAEDNKILGKGTKADLVSRLSSTVPPKKVLECVSNKELQAILARYQLPTSGTKSELVKRVLSIVKPLKRQTAKQAKELAGQPTPVSEKETAYSKGHRFEDEVAVWAKKAFKELSPSVQTRMLVNGLSTKRPYEVDVYLHCKGRGLFAGTGDIWIDCKKKEKSSVKRGVIMELVVKAQDVYRAKKAGREDMCFNGLIVASNQIFDSDALRYATQEDVLCVRFDGKRCAEQNQPKNVMGSPAWLKQLKGS